MSLFLSCGSFCSSQHRNFRCLKTASSYLLDHRAASLGYPHLLCLWSLLIRLFLSTDSLHSISDQLSLVTIIDKMRFSVLVLGLLASVSYAMPRTLEICRGVSSSHPRNERPRSAILPVSFIFQGNSTCDATATLGQPTACCIGLSCDKGVSDDFRCSEL